MDEEELRPRTPSGPVLGASLDGWSVEHLEAYLERLRQEIERVRAELERRAAVRRSAEALFRGRS